MYCKNCGYKLGENAKFCRNCGAKIQETEQHITTKNLKKVKATYTKDNGELKITYNEKKFDTSRIKNISIEQWAYPFLSNGIKWNGLYEELKDFTYFDNMIGGGAPTALGVPLMLTGYQYDTTHSLADYRKKAYEEGTLIQDMSDNGYDVKLYTSSEYLNGVNQEAVANTAGGQKYRISDKVQFFKNIYKMSAFYAFPQIIKQYFWFYGDDFAACQAPENNNIIQYELDDSQLYADFKNNGGITVDAGNKTFTLYHMVGAHAPYEMNEQCVDVGETETSLDKQIQGVFRYINGYMQQMKDKGVYDNSTVIITADHGGYGLYERPAVFVKMADTHNDVMQVNSDSVTFKNLYATYGEAALGQKSNYGNTLFDMAGVSQSRYHVAPWDVSKGMYPADEYLKNRDYSVFRIEGDAVNPQISVIKDEQQMKNINN